MDSNLSLLEIAGEDDSLLQIPRDESGVNNTSNIFSCSPLHCLRSLHPRAPQTEGRVGAVDFEKLSSSPQDGINKENINGNKSEAPKLSLEPQQMKRKKKGGGYNLRKSLAWDRAFFTEEGVLNPLELSMISGNNSRTNRELTVIYEEEQGESDIIVASSELQEIEGNLFKQLSEDRKIGACLSPKSDASTKDTLASASLAKRKVLAVNDIYRSRSKRNACPLPVTSSSPETAKAQSKESKVSKIPVSKTNVSVITTTARRGASIAGYSKRNQNAHSAANVQKNAGVKGLAKNIRSVPVNAKFDVADKCSVTRTPTWLAGKDFDNSASETHPLPRLHHQLANEANKGLEVHPPRGVCNTGEKKQQTQFQIAKPSGLRMPSPSLGFFSQQKPSSSHSVLHKSSKPCKPAKSNIPKPRKCEANSVKEAMPPHAPRSSELVNGAAKNCTLKFNLSDVKSEPSLQVQNDQKEKVEVQCYSLGSEEIAGQEKVEKILEHANKKSLKQIEPFKSENVSNMEEIESHRNHNELLLGSDTDEPLLETNRACGSESKIAEMEDCQHPGDGQSGFVHRRPVDNGYNQLIDAKLRHDRTQANSFQLDRMCEDYITVSTTACSSEVNNVSLESRSFYENNIEHSTGTSLHCDSLIAQHDNRGNFEQQARLLTSSKINMLCENESSVANHSHLLDESESFEASADINSNTKVITGSGAESTSGLFEHKLLVQAVRESDYTTRVIEDLHVRDAQVLSSDENLVARSYNNNPSTSVAKDQFAFVVDSVNEESHLLELQRPNLVVDVDFQHDNHKLYLKGDLLPANIACPEEIRSENLFEGVLEQCNDYASEYNTSNHHVQATSETEDGKLEVDERVECLQMDGADKVSAQRVEVELNHKVNAVDFVSSLQRSEDQITEVVDWKCNELGSLSESSKLQVADNPTSQESTPQGSVVSSLKRKSLSEEAENSTFGKDEISNTNIQNQNAEDSSEIMHLKKSWTKSKQDVPTVMAPPNAAPFSDEWLAAMEAAGEEILTMKSGAVQNSPPDKPQQEPGPWSPVRRKNQGIGPYDCTKYTNMNIQHSSSE